MIVYEAGFPAVEKAAGRPLDRPRILYSTYTRNTGIDAADVTVSTETAAGPRDAPLRPETHDFWQGTAVPATWELNLGTDFSVNAIFLLHTCGSSGNTIAVDTENSASPGTFSEFADDHTPTDDAGTLFLDAARNVRKLRLTFSNGSAPRLFVVYLGLVLPMERSVAPPFTPPNLARETELSARRARNGALLGQSFRRLGVKSQISFRRLTPSWYRTNFDPFVKEARRYPYVLAWNALDFNTDVSFLWLPDGEDIVPSYSADAPLFDVSWNLVGLDHG